MHEDNFLDFMIFNIIGAAAMLLFTSYLDVKRREVEDKIWLIFGVTGVALQAYEILNGYTNILSLGISLTLATIIGLGLFFFGFYGGADGKALIALAILVPQFNPHVGLYTIAPLMVLTNGVLISILLPVSILILNGARLLRHQEIFEGFTEPFHRKLLACLLGFKQTGKPRDFQFIMEKTVKQEDGLTQKKFDFSLMHDEFETESGTWVTPGIPLLVFFTIGYFVMLWYGDLVIALIEFLARTL
ncbi:MAG: prepilin peptidase [Nitrososphaerota archaeon]|nr:prepilin peptidase [Nitrososphaerota archaeon]